MRPEIYVFVAILAIVAIADYILLIAASRAEEREEKMRRELEKEKRKNEYHD